ncbi:uroporphyrinogen decarboxylase family protein [Geomonas sp. Red32]|uniref:uroporphyrinogen decarboxylase family protein n=1 Tax=Geomonas sp. Red32 TaxID=2912856 RepID=UPI00202CD92B|nr:uroporphyrinogen decarboxylase family protein [Geomonas sp. Red32]MCM0083814.1 uroporphyrinogen decarboxylase family protein [Geomonas sp. Red32]
MTAMTSLQRVLATMGNREPDRVPYFLSLTMHGARELGLSIKEYFSKGELVAEGQLRMRAKYGHDCLNGFSYAPVEVEAWGGEVIFSDDGPPNSGAPFIRSPEEIGRLTPPSIADSPCLQEVLKAQQIMKSRAGGEVPIVGVVVSPFSAPVMQMGFAPYLDLIFEQPSLFERLMAVNEEFCVAWANAQLAAGATFICYFDPVSSASIVPRDLYLKTGFPVAKRTIARIKGATATHFASGRCLSVVGDVADTGTKAIGVSVLEDLKTVKEACRGRLTVVGNLNAIEMRHWSDEDAERSVRNAIAAAGAGGGFILADNHGEIPWQVPEPVLYAIAESVRRWGRYPLAQVEEHG